jgi:hypothetical protein
VNKARLARSLHAADHAHDVCPRSFAVSSKQEAKVAVLKVQEHASELFYFKDPSVQRGQGITLLRDWADVEEFKARVMVVQKAVRPLLIGGYKFGVRVNALCVQWPQGGGLVSVFVFEEGIWTRCGEKYDESSLDLAVHVASSSVQRAAEGFVLENVKGRASTRFSGFAQSLPAVCAKICVCVKAALDAGMRPDQPLPQQAVACQLFGFDVLWDADCEPWLCEANAAPQFQDSKRLPELVESFALPMVNGLAAVLARGHALRRDRFAREDQPSWRWVGDV